MFDDVEDIYWAHKVLFTDILNEQALAKENKYVKKVPKNISGQPSNVSSQIKDILKDPAIILSEDKKIRKLIRQLLLVLDIKSTQIIFHKIKIN